jgi:hypothetical protein
MIDGEVQADHSRLEARIAAANDELAALLVVDDRHGAEQVLDELCELAWQHRAAVVRGRRHAGPGLRVPDRGAGAGREAAPRARILPSLSSHQAGL